MSIDLSQHPTKRHPLTGEPLRAVYVRSDGRVFWPIMGGAEDGDGTDDAGTKDAAAGAAATDDGKGDQGTNDQGGADKGFPENTPVAEMTAPQQAAYWQDKARKHETRATEYRQAVGGKTAAEVQAELEQLRRDKMTADERAIDDAKRQAREEATREYAPQAVRTAFDLLLGDMPDEERNAEIELLDLSKFLTDSGAVDTAKVRRAAGKIAHTDKDKGNGQQFDFGAGNRGGSQAAGGVAVGANRYAERKKPSATSSTN